MNKEEQVNIEITEQSEENKQNNIFDFELNTGESKKISITTDDNYNKKLDAMMIVIENQADIKLSLANHPEIVLFEKVSMIGTHYIPLRVTPRNNEDEIFNFGPQKYYVTDQIKIEVMGADFTVVKLRLIFDD